MNLRKYVALPVLLASLAVGCGKSEEKEEPFNLSINGSQYNVSESSILQTKSSFLDDGEIRIGLVSDIEGAIENAIRSAAKLKKAGIDAVLIAGDTYENEKIRRNPVYPNSKNNLEEMINGIRPYAELGVPVFVIPGNHEKQSIYAEALSELREDYPNVLDINKKSVDLQGVNIVGMGGYHDPRFIDKEGFVLKEEDYKRSANRLKELQKQGEKIIFLTHGPSKSNTGIDYVRGAGHVGDNATREIMDSDLKDITQVFGHIHEGGRNIEEYNAGIGINVASITDYNNSKGTNTGLIVIKDGSLGYKELK